MRGVGFRCEQCGKHALTEPVDYFDCSGLDRVKPPQGWVTLIVAFAAPEQAALAPPIDFCSRECVYAYTAPSDATPQPTLEKIDLGQIGRDLVDHIRKARIS